MQITRTVRKHRTKEQRQQILESYRRSRLSQRQFAAQAGIGLSTLQLWRRQAASPSAKPPATFIELPQVQKLTRAHSVYRLHIAGGMELEIISGFRAEELSTLLRVLREL